MKDQNLSLENLTSSLRMSVSFLENTFGAEAPKVAVVLGSGLGAFVEELKNPQSIESSRIPGVAASTVVGHSGKLVVGRIGDTKVAVISGRIRGYEGHEPEKVVHLVRSLRFWGIPNFILTNAAGSTKLSYKPGQLILLKDHINCTGHNPLVGKETFGCDRFPDMSDAYSKDWRKKVLVAAKKIKVPLKEGVYVGLLGPCYETAAEIRMYAKIGGDLVGMSTVWENIALNQLKAKILGISVVTNFGTGVTKQPLGHEEVLETTARVRGSVQRLLANIISQTLPT